MTWQTCVQNPTESMYSTPPYAASDTITMFAIVNANTRTVICRWRGSFKSTRGHCIAEGGLPAARRRRSIQAPSGISRSPAMNSAGTTTKNTMPEYGFV